MKTLFGLLILTVAGIITYTQTEAGETTSQDDFEKMTFEVEFSKNNYVLFEPIFVKFKFSNQTGSPQTTYQPSFLQESKLKVNFNGRTSVFEHLSSVNGPGIRFPGDVPSLGFSISDEMLNSPSVGIFFPEPGNYQLQFVLHSAGRDKTIKSNIIKITIEKPAGIDNDAFKFMRKHHEFFGLSSWTPDSNESLTLLEKFIRKYGQSVYGETAISSLGIFYLARGEFEKAKVEFEKIKSSNNTIIAREANRSLADIAKRQADSQKIQKQAEGALLQLQR